MPRVLSVIHGPVFGGAHNQLVRLQPGLARAGFETVAALPPEADEAARRIEAAGIEVIRIPLASLRATWDPRVNLATLSNLRGDVRRLRGVIRERSIDLVQVHGMINPQAGVAAHREGAAVVWQLLDSRAPMALRRLVMPFVTRAADAITSWGRALAATHPGATKLGRRLVIVFPPVDPGLEPDPDAGVDARAVLGATDDELLVGTLGVRNSQKGHDQLVRAAALVKRTKPEARFRILGTASPPHLRHMEAVEREAEELGLARPQDIDFLDPGDDPARLLQGIDVFAFSSRRRSEGMPTAILEAMACGKPVVATDVGAVRELVEDRVTGYLVPPDDPEALADAIAGLLDDDELRAGIGRAGRERAIERFSLGRLAELHVEAYSRALDHRAARLNGGPA